MAVSALSQSDLFPGLKVFLDGAVFRSGQVDLVFCGTESFLVLKFQYAGEEEK